MHPGLSLLITIVSRKGSGEILFSWTQTSFLNAQGKESQTLAPSLPVFWRKIITTTAAMRTPREPQTTRPCSLYLPNINRPAETIIAQEELEVIEMAQIWENRPDQTDESDSLRPLPEDQNQEEERTEAQDRKELIKVYKLIHLQLKDMLALAARAHADTIRVVILLLIILVNQFIMAFILPSILLPIFQSEDVEEAVPEHRVALNHQVPPEQRYPPARALPT